VGIATDSLRNEVKNLCGEPKFSAHIGDYSYNIIQNFGDAAFDNPECFFYTGISTNGSNDPVHTYFPFHRLKLSYSNYQLKSVFIYARPNEVK
jgi:hypothetical protein